MTSMRKLTGFGRLCWPFEGDELASGEPGSDDSESAVTFMLNEHVVESAMVLSNRPEEKFGAPQWQHSQGESDRPSASNIRFEILAQCWWYQVSHVWHSMLAKAPL